MRSPANLNVKIVVNFFVSEHCGIFYLKFLSIVAFLFKISEHCGIFYLKFLSIVAFFILNLTSFFENTFQNIYYEFNKTLNYIGDNRVFRSYYRHWTRCVPYLITPERKELDFPYVGES